MLGHGLACQALRADDPAADLGIALNLYAVSAAAPDPADPSPADADADAARRIDGLANRIFLDPILRGEYPADVLEDLRPISLFEHVRDGDLATIATPLGFLGINYYSRYVVAAPPGDHPSPRTNGPSAWPGSEAVQFVTPDVSVTGMGWAIDPDGLAETLIRLHHYYPPLPVYIMENGAAFDDAVDDDGRIHDPDRTAYIAAHLSACHRAIQAGAPLRGYFVWSFLDNFEWAHGYSHRFGLVHVDYADQRRTPKSSAHWYADVIVRNGLGA